MVNSPLKKPHLLRCGLVRLCDAIPPRSLACASHLRLFQRTVEARLNNIFFIFIITSALVSTACEAMTEEQNNQLIEETKNYKFKTVTTKEGFNFNIPEDMPIETRAGITAPIPFDEYMYFKFKKVEERLVVIEKKIDDLQQMLILAKKPELEKSVSPAEKAGVLSSS